MKNNIDPNIIVAILWTVIFVWSAVNCYLGASANHVVQICAAGLLVFRYWIDVFFGVKD